MISHAACAGHLPENTLAGVRLALSLGADAIEVDVQASKEGIPVLMHDPTVDRTTDGSGTVSSLTLEELRRLDAGQGEPVPTLAEALALTKGHVLLVIEIKQGEIAQGVADVIRKARALGDVMIWSFLPQVLEEMRRAEPRLPVGLILAPQALRRWPQIRETALHLGALGLGAFYSDINVEVMAWARDSQLKIFAWTVDLENDIKRLMELGVDGIVTNFPERVLALLGRLG